MRRRELDARYFLDSRPWAEKRLDILSSVARRPDTTPAEVDRALSDLGYQLYEQLLPAKLQEMCWTLRDRRVKTVLILSDEPHIPWELIKPFRADPASGCLERDDHFWGETYALTHWLRGRPPVQQLSLQRVFALATGTKAGNEGTTATRDIELLSAEPGAPSQQPGTHGEAAIGFADEELNIVRALETSGSRVRVLPPKRQDLYEAFERGEFDLLHVACHGQFGGAAEGDSSAVMLDDGAFHAAELSPRMVGAIRLAAPLIFFNACHSGRLGFSLTRLGAWGASLVQMGCGAFIGSLWPVTDRAALAFAEAFYPLLAQGLPLGEAVLRARQQVRERHPNDPSWLAYCCFADPMARIAKTSGTYTEMAVS